MRTIFAAIVFLLMLGLLTGCAGDQAAGRRPGTPTPVQRARPPLAQPTPTPGAMSVEQRQRVWVDGLIREINKDAIVVHQPQRDGEGPTTRVRIAHDAQDDTAFLRYDPNARVWVQMSDSEIGQLGLDDPICVNSFSASGGLVGNQVFVGAGCGPVPPSQAPSTFAP